MMTWQVRCQRFGQRLDVELPVTLRCQEMQHRSVMPQVYRLCRSKSRHVCGRPRHSLRTRAETGPGVIGGCLAQIEDLDIVELSIEEAVDKG